MIPRPPPRDRLSTLAPWLVAGILVAASMAVAASFAPPPGPDGPGGSFPSGSGTPAPSIVTTAYGGPPLIGVFTGCNPACDLELATEGIGRRLTFTDRAVDESAPSLSPDLRRVVFRCAEPGVEPGGTEPPRPAGHGSLCILDIPEDPEQPATTSTFLETAGVDYGAPAWSPDGSTIAFDYNRGSDEVGIGIVPAGGGEPRVLTGGIGLAWGPAWSADGSMLAFTCGAGIDSTPSTRFCIMASEGGDVTALGEVAGGCGTPTFMPDGVHLGVVCVVPDARGGDLFMLALDEPFTHSFTESQLIAPEGARRVAFDPGQHFAYVRRDDALWAIGIPEGQWSLPALPPLHGDFDLRVLAR